MAASSICSPALARSSRAATPRELRRSRLTIKQHRQHSHGSTGTASAELVARLASSLRNSRRVRSTPSSHRRRSNGLSSLTCNYTLAWDIKQSTRLITRQLSSSSAASGAQKRRRRL
jgi:hypothetical protein